MNIKEVESEAFRSYGGPEIEQKESAHWADKLTGNHQHTCSWNFVLLANCWMCTQAN